jgi:tetratricopeptide (TPR) repeat protein
MVGSLTASEEAQLTQTIEMFEVITQSQPQDYQSLEILKEAYYKLGREQDVIRTSKRIAEAYVLMGQLSSAILEYESILQRYPEDPEVLAALVELESKANTLNVQASIENTEIVKAAPKDKESRAKAGEAKASSAAEVEDGRQQMYKLFVESKVIAQGDFEQCWVHQDLTKPPAGIVDPFVQLLMDKGILPIEKSLKLISDKNRLAYLPIEKYDLDVELIRSCPSLTLQRWCILPFDRMSKSVLVATANPFNKQAAGELERALKQRLIWYLASPPDITKALRRIVR